MEKAGIEIERPLISKLEWDRPGRGGPPRPPDWVFEAVGVTVPVDPGDGTPPRQRPRPVPARLPGMALLAVRLDRAVDQGAADLRRAVRRLYGELLRRAARAGTPHPLRIWSFIPRIHERLGEDLSRYVVFNAGRHDAFFHGGHPSRGRHVRLPASTGVGYSGPDLLLYCLTSERPGHPIENPRQKPAYRYSPAYGPLPPCFARATATRLGDVEMLLVSGTAAVCGEDSVHIGSLEGQLNETFINLESLLATARFPPEPDEGERGVIGTPGLVLNRLRVYYLRDGDLERIIQAVMDRFPGLRDLEMVRADICREDLLVEIEGVASRDPKVP